MAPISCLLFLCSICLYVFTEPINKPHEHSCKNCITEHECAMCNEKLHVKYEEKKAELGKTEADFQQMIQNRQKKIQEIKHSGHLEKEDANREKAEDALDFTSLIEFAERSLNELIKTIDVKQRTTQKYTVDIDELEQEISELMKRRTEVKHLSSFEDHNDWADFHVNPSSHEETVLGTLIQLEEAVSKVIKKLLAEAELKRVQQYEVDVTLDPDTANPWLILSDDEKQVKESDVKKNLPDNPERFSKFLFVLGKQNFSSGRFYYEVQVKGKTVWFLGVATESIDRKEIILPRPQSGYWAIWLNGGNQYKVLDDPPVVLSLKSQPEKVGVFVDYEEGLVSFYDVDAAALIYSFTGCCFTEKLYPYLSPGIDDHGKNSAPLIISPVIHTDVD